MITEYRKKIPPLVFFLILMFLLGCGRAIQKQLIPTVPVANAGEDQAVFIDLQCELDGGLSTGNVVNYQWRTKAVPAGAVSPSIDFSTSRKAFFTPTAVGTFEFELELSNSLGISTDEVNITVIPSVTASAEAGFHGICAHLQSHDGGSDLDRSLSLLVDSGAKFVRFDFDWKDIEPDDDRFDFSKYDAIVSRLQQKNIQILGILDYGNNWSDPTTGDKLEVDRFADYVYHTVKHFKAQIKHWQIWNEPNNYLFWASPSAGNYFKLLKVSYAAVKQGNPEAVVVLGGINGNGKDSITILGLNLNFARANFLPDLYSLGAKKYFDIAAIHPYTYGDVISSTVKLATAIDDARTIMAANGDANKNLWITELGPFFFPPSTANPIVIFFFGSFTDDQVANWLSLIYNDLKPKCDKLFWYELRDDPTPFSLTNLNPDWEGLVKPDYTQKAAYSAYKNLLK